MAEITERSLTITAADGTALDALLLAPPEPRLGVLMTSGTGFPKEFYLRFCRYGAERGASVLLYDFRGIGGSAPETLRGYEADVTDWGRLDMPAAIDALKDAAPDLPLVSLGHSVGGHVLGFAPNNTVFERNVFVCVGSGTWRKHHLRSQPLELIFWWLYGPACLALKGYIPAGGLWGGTALPRGVYTQWRAWCQQDGYLFEDLDGELAPHHFDAVTAPITSYIFTDDPISTPVTAEDVLAAYPNAPREKRVLAPHEFGLARIGHQNAFRRASEPVWPTIWDRVLGEET